MKVFEANMGQRVSDYLNDNLKDISLFEIANQKLFDFFKIKQFFEKNEELEHLKLAISDALHIVEEIDRAEYGDFQTNADLAHKATLHLVLKNISPEIIVEPTCGKGNFIIAALSNFKHIKNIFGVEIYKPYVWETKFNIINFYLENPDNNKPEILISHCNVFDFDFKTIAKQDFKKQLDRLNDLYKFNLTLDLWDSFLKEMSPVNNGQFAMVF